MLGFPAGKIHLCLLRCYRPPASVCLFQSGVHRYDTFQIWLWCTRRTWSNHYRCMMVNLLDLFVWNIQHTEPYERHLSLSCHIYRTHPFILEMVIFSGEQCLVQFHSMPLGVNNTTYFYSTFCTWGCITQTYTHTHTHLCTHIEYIHAEQIGGGGRDAETTSRQPAASQRREQLRWWLCNPQLHKSYHYT